MSCVTIGPRETTISQTRHLYFSVEMVKETLTTNHTNKHKITKPCKERDMGLCKVIIRFFGLIRKIREYLPEEVSIELGYRGVVLKELKVWLDWTVRMNSR